MKHLGDITKINWFEVKWDPHVSKEITKTQLILWFL